MPGRTDSALLTERLRSCADKLGPQAESIERRGRIPPGVIEELRSSALFRAFVPARYGGLESSLLPVLEGLVELGRACASTSWVSSLFVTHSLIGAWFPERAQDALWAHDPNTLLGSSLAPVGQLEVREGGYALSGDWSYSSGIDHADWLILGARQKRLGNCLVLVRASEARVTDDWDVCGLEGTGSKSLSVRDCFVPEAFLLAMSDLELGSAPGKGQNSAPLFRLPWRPLFSLSFVPPALGTAQAALATSREYLRGKASAFTGKKFLDNPLGWVRLAESAGEIETASTLMRRDVEEMEECLRENGSVPPSLVHRASYTPALMVSLCRRAVSRLFHITGGRAVYRNSSLQRNFRDIEAIGQHPGVNLDLAAQVYGRALLEQPELEVGARPPC